MSTQRSAPRTARAIARAELTAAILERARDQLAEVGPAALSVRAIARDLEMASSAVYRYFPSRDALLTELISEGYADLADHVDAAVEDARQARPTAYADQWRAWCHAIRDWARVQPHRYALLYGSPVPGYAAPGETVPHATRVTLALLSILSAAHATGALEDTGSAAAPAVSPAEVAALGPVLGFTETPLDPAVALRGTVAWAAVFGHLSLELFGHMHRGILDYDVHFAAAIDQVAATLGLPRETR